MRAVRLQVHPAGHDCRGRELFRGLLPVYVFCNIKPFDVTPVWMNLTQYGWPMQDCLLSTRAPAALKPAFTITHPVTRVRLFFRETNCLFVLEVRI